MILSKCCSKNIFMTIASEDEIYKIMSMGIDKSDRAIITLILSSGLLSKFIEEMTYEQLLNACDHYFKYDEMKTIPNLVKKNPREDNFIACFDFGKKSKPRMTCCSPESLQLIIEYLRYRKNIEIDSEKDYVFLNYRNDTIVDKDHISSIFRRAREKASRYLPNGESLEITSDDVRDRFKHICENRLQGRHRNEILTLMNVNNSDFDKRFYEYIKDNKFILIDHYLTVVGYLTLSSSNNQLDRTIGNYTTNFGF